MRQLTTFKVGDKIKVVNEPEVWLMLQHNKNITIDTEFVVEQIINVDSNAHNAFDDNCDDTNCIHKLSHYQLLVHSNGQKSSGYWFDPLIKEQNKERKIRYES